MKRLSLCLLALVCTSSAFSQFLPIPPLPRYRIVPYVDTSTAYFAYLQVHSDDSQSLRTARIIATSPQPKCVPVTLLETANGYETEILDVIASPDNQYIVSHSLQNGLDFIDIDFNFYNLRTGTYLGLRNEHNFSEINNTTATSQVYEDFLADESALTGESIAFLRTIYDFYLEIELGYIDIVDYGWNADGTFGITYLMEVWIRDGIGDAFSFYAGQETFTKNYHVTNSGVSFASYGVKTPATYPLTFPLSPQSGPTGTVRFLGQNLLMRIWYSFGTWQIFRDYPFSAYLTEGVIPARYRIERL